MTRFADYTSLATRVRLEQAKDIASIRGAGYDAYYHADPQPHFDIPADVWSRITKAPAPTNPLLAGVVGWVPLGVPVYHDCPFLPPATPPEPK